MLRRRTVLLCAAWLAVFLAAAARGGPLEDAARTAGKPLIVRFGLERCLQCIKQGEAFAELEPRYAGRMEFRFVHIGEEEEMAGEYQVLLIPTVLFFDAAGTEVFRHVGYLDAGALESRFGEAGLPGGSVGGTSR